MRQGNKENLTIWRDALLSGNYKQGRQRLARDLPNGETEYCCLGVVCDLMGLGYELAFKSDSGSDRVYGDSKSNGYHTVLPIDAQKWLGVDGHFDGLGYMNTIPPLEDLAPLDRETTTLAGANDSGGISFAQIADWITQEFGLEPPK